LVEHADEVGGRYFAVNATASAVRILYMQGRIEEANLEYGKVKDDLIRGPMQARLLALLGHHGEATDLLQQEISTLDSQQQISGDSINMFSNLLDTAIMLNRTDPIRALFARLEPAAHRLVLRSADSIPVARLLGEASMLLREPLQAHFYFELALQVCEAARIRPEIALTRLGLAELLLEHYPDERDDAIKHLDFAIAEFQAMKMQPSLERALGHRGLLKA
jgi:hypothetical protein